MIIEDYVFECRKCGHQVYTDELDKIIDIDCPNCGEEFWGNFVFKGKGVFPR